MSELETRTGRDTRLLALVIVIAVAVLFGLARFRYPAAEVAPAPPTPLSRLAATGTYDDLGSAMRAALQAAQPALIAIRLEPASKERDKDKDREKGVDPDDTNAGRRALAIRIGLDAAAVHLPPGYHVPNAAGDFNLRRVDDERRVAYLAVPAAPGSTPVVRPAPDLAGFAYVAVVEAAIGGPTARPLFVGRVDAVSDAKWNGTVLAALEFADLPAGALVFLLDGRFAGIALDAAAGGRVLVPAAVLEALAAGPPGNGRAAR